MNRGRVLRPCLDCGLPTDNGSRCPMHQRQLQRRIDNSPARRARKRMLYGAEHRAQRAAWAVEVDAGNVRCWRCGGPIAQGAPWDLGHRPGKPSHPEHPACNRGAR